MELEVADQSPGVVPIVGRPTKYDKAYADQAYKYCLLGATNTQLAQFFGVSDATIDNWLRDQPKFLGSVKRGRIEADANIANSLYHRALGYSHKAVKILQDKDKNSFEHEYTEHYPPDTAAAFIWLKNRQPKIWREDAATVQIANETSALLAEALSREELEALRARLLAYQAQKALVGGGNTAGVGRNDSTDAKQGSSENTTCEVVDAIQQPK